MASLQNFPGKESSHRARVISSFFAVQLYSRPVNQFNRWVRYGYVGSEHPDFPLWHWPCLQRISEQVSWSISISMSVCVALCLPDDLDPVVKVLGA